MDRGFRPRGLAPATATCGSQKRGLLPHVGYDARRSAGRPGKGHIPPDLVVNT
jgi:hypothetical protein